MRTYQGARHNSAVNNNMYVLLKGYVMEKKILLPLLLTISLIGAKEGTNISQDAMQLPHPTMEQDVIATFTRGRKSKERRELFDQLQQLPAAEQELMVEFSKPLTYVTRHIPQDRFKEFIKLIERHPELMTKSLGKSLKAFAQYHNLSEAKKKHVKSLIAQ